MVGIQVGNEQEERKGEEKKMIRENKRLHCPEQCGRRLLREHIDDMTYDICGSGFDDATFDV